LILKKKSIFLVQRWAVFKRAPGLDENVSKNQQNSLGLWWAVDKWALVFDENKPRNPEN
jgi:hypothetical protein